MITQREVDHLQQFITVPIEVREVGGQQVIRLHLPPDENGDRGILAIESVSTGVRLCDQSAIR